VVVLLATAGIGTLLLGEDTSPEFDPGFESAALDAAESLASRVDVPSGDPGLDMVAVGEDAISSGAEQAGSSEANSALESEPEADETGAPPEPAVVRGRVEDPWGEPLADARVSARSMGRRGGGGSVEAKTDALGRFELSVPAGGALLLAEAEGLAPSEAEWMRLPAGEARELVLQVRQPTTLRGRVLTADGSPAAGASVSVSEGRGPGARGEPVLADDEGRFEFLELGEGLYRVTAALDGYVSESQDSVPVSLEQGGEVDFALAAAGRIVGSLRKPDGTPLAGAHVFPQLSGRGARGVRTDDEGQFQLEGLPEGELELFVRSEDYGHTARETVVVQAGASIALDVVVREGPKIKGVLRDSEGEPLADLVVRARSEEGEVRREGKTDADGRYTVANLYPGRYTVSVSAGRRRAGLIERELDVGEVDLVLDLVVPSGGTLQGRVVGPDGAPIAEASVYAIVEEDYRGQAQTDAEGVFALADLPADTYRLFVRVGEDRLVGSIEQIHVRQGEAREDVVVVARPPATLRARLLDSAGTPIVGAVIEASAVGSPVQRRGRTDADGRVELGPLYDGGYRLTVREGGLALAARKLGVHELTVDPLTVRIEGRDLELELAAVVVEE